MTALIVVLNALLASGAHVLTGPDHLAAVLPIALADRARALRVAALWGAGHGAGVLILGLLGQVLLTELQVVALSSLSDVMVGVLLVVVGVRAWRRQRWVTIHTHGHTHRPVRAHRFVLSPSVLLRHAAHQHLHVHVGAEADGRAHGPAAHRAHHHGAFGFGLLHGAAGGGHLFGVLPSLALSPPMAALYLAVYLSGAVAAMVVFTVVCTGLVRPAHLPRALRVASVASVAIGVTWIAAGVAG